MSNTVHNPALVDANTTYAIQDQSSSSAQSTGAAQAPPSPALLQANFREREAFMAKLAKDDAADDSKTRTMQRFFAQNDSTGSDDGDALHAKMAKAAGGMGLPAVGKAHVHAIATRVSGHPATKELAGQIKDAMQGKGAVPGHEQLARAAGQALGDTGTFGASTGQPTGNLRSASSKLAGAASGEGEQADSQSGASGTSGASAQPSSGADGASGTSGTTGSAAQSSTDPSDPHNFKAVANAVRDGKLQPSQVSGDVIGFVYAVMMQAQIDGNKDKREELNHTQMLNGMSDALSEYMSNTLMPAQKLLSQKTAKASDKQRQNAENITVTVEPVMSDVNTGYGMRDQSGKYHLIAQYGENGGREQVSQTTLQQMNSQVQQWQTSIQNNQTKQTNRFQATDSAQTSNMNIINSLLKSVHDATNAIVHNLQT